MIVGYFLNHFRENILKTAKALVEDTKLLVSGAAASQEKLAHAAQSSVLTITRLADVVKLGAASLGSDDPETQVIMFSVCFIPVITLLCYPTSKERLQLVNYCYSCFLVIKTGQTTSHFS